MASQTQSTLFAHAVKNVLNSWTVLQLAVSHGFGGQESKEKAEWMAHAVDQWFQENKNIESYEVEDFLADVLSAEFDTVADDGSLPQIAALICSFYKLCSEGKTSDVQEKVQKLPKAALQNCARANSDEELEEDEVNEMDDSSTGQMTQQPPQPHHSFQQNPPGGICQPQPGTSNDTGDTNGAQNSESMDVEETDGWQVVQRGKKR